MSASPYFKFYSSDFLTGILGMDPDEIAVYTVIIVMIYDRGEPITADMDALAWRLRMSAKCAVAVARITVGRALGEMRL